MRRFPRRRVQEERRTQETRPVLGSGRPEEGEERGGEAEAIEPDPSGRLGQAMGKRSGSTCPNREWEVHQEWIPICAGGCQNREPRSDQQICERLTVAVAEWLPGGVDGIHERGEREQASSLSTDRKGVRVRVARRDKGLVRTRGLDHDRIRRCAESKRPLVGKVVEAPNAGGLGTGERPKGERVAAAIARGSAALHVSCCEWRGCVAEHQGVVRSAARSPSEHPPGEIPRRGQYTSGLLEALRAEDLTWEYGSELRAKDLGHVDQRQILPPVVVHVGSAVIVEEGHEGSIGERLGRMQGHQVVTQAIGACVLEDRVTVRTLPEPIMSYKRDSLKHAEVELEGPHTEVVHLPLGRDDVDGVVGVVGALEQQLIDPRRSDHYERLLQSYQDEDEALAAREVCHGLAEHGTGRPATVRRLHSMSQTSRRGEKIPRSNPPRRCVCLAIDASREGEDRF